MTTIDSITAAQEAAEAGDMEQVRLAKCVRAISDAEAMAAEGR